MYSLYADSQGGITVGVHIELKYLALHLQGIFLYSCALKLLPLESTLRLLLTIYVCIQLMLYGHFMSP